MRLGRDVVFDFLRDLGVKYLFGVPGTNEIPIIDGTSVAGNGVTYVPCLHENIAMGAAMGYARESGLPGVLELHVTPGAAHGIGNLYNAQRSHTPMVVLCAQQHSELLAQEPVLSSDLVQVARQYTKWAYEVRFAGELPLVLQRAFKEALAAPMGPVFISIPWNFTLEEVPDGPSKVTRVSARGAADAGAIAAAAERLAAAEHPIIVAGDGAGAAGAWDGLERLADLLGAPVYTESLSSYMNYPNDRHRWQGELPQNQVAMHAVFKDHDVAFTCGFGAQAQVFVYKHDLGPLIPADLARVELHDDEWQLGKNGYAEVAMLGDIAATLPALCDAVAAHPRHSPEAAAQRNDHLARLGQERSAAFAAHRDALAARGDDALPTGADVAAALAALQPEMKAPMTLVNEAVSNVPDLEAALHFDGPASYFFGAGGSLGYSMPASVGMKLAAGDRRTIVNAVGDGSTLFYPTTWWTVRRHELPILFVITNNREYRTLRLGLELMEKTMPWQPAGPDWYLGLDQPPVIDFVGLAAQFGVDGACVGCRGELAGGLRAGLDAVEAGRPFVLEVLVDPALHPPTPPPRLDALRASKENDVHPGLEHIGPA